MRYSPGESLPMSKLENGEADSSVRRLQQAPVLPRHTEALCRADSPPTVPMKGKLVEGLSFLHASGKLELPWNTGLTSKILILEDL